MMFIMKYKDVICIVVAIMIFERGSNGQTVYSYVETCSNYTFATFIYTCGIAPKTVVVKLLCCSFASYKSSYTNNDCSSFLNFQTFCKRHCNAEICDKFYDCITKNSDSTDCNSYFSSFSSNITTIVTTTSKRSNTSTLTTTLNSTKSSPSLFTTAVFTTLTTKNSKITSTVSKLTSTSASSSNASIFPTTTSNENAIVTDSKLSKTSTPTQSYLVPQWSEWQICILSRVRRRLNDSSKIEYSLVNVSCSLINSANETVNKITKIENIVETKKDEINNKTTSKVAAISKQYHATIIAVSYIRYVAIGFICAFILTIILPDVYKLFKYLNIKPTRIIKKLKKNNNKIKPQQGDDEHINMHRLTTEQRKFIRDVDIRIQKLKEQLERSN